MKKPDKTKSPEKAETADQPTQPSPARKAAADPGVIASAPIPPGDGRAAAATGGEIAPVKSTLLGDGTGQNPPARRKAGASVSDARADDRAQDEMAQDVQAATVDRDTPETRPSSAPPAPSGAAVPAVRKTGFWPVFLGGVVAAGLGSAATIWALPNLPAGWLPQEETEAVAPAPEVDIDAIRAEAVSAAEEAAQATAQSTAQSTAESVVAQQIAALREELTVPAEPAEAATADAPVGEAPVGEAVPAEPVTAAPEAPAVSVEEVAALREQVEQQAARIQELLDRPQIDPALAERVETLAGQADTLEQQIQTAAQAAQAQINEAQAEAERLQQAAAESTRRAEAVAAVAALQSALDRGVTPDEARETLEGAGLETPEALAREVPSLDSLQARFPEAARAALRASLREDSTAGNGNLFTNFLRAQTGARSVAPREGSDPDAILSRAGVAVEAGRIGDAVAELEVLPEPARAAPVMADWLADATAYRDAQAALSDLSVPSN